MVNLSTASGTVFGSGGADVFISGKGNDVLSGGDGDDLFRVGISAGTDSYDGVQGSM